VQLGGAAEAAQGDVDPEVPVLEEQATKGPLGKWQLRIEETVARQHSHRERWIVKGEGGPAEVDDLGRHLMPWPRFGRMPSGHASL
jgi:hypothetical protein